MRILQVIQERTVGGAEGVVRSLTKGARERGHEVSLAAADRLHAPEPSGTVHPLPLIGRKPWRLVPAAVAVHRAVRLARPDLIHCHNPGIAAAVGLATRRGRAPVSLVTVHGVPDEDYGRAAVALRLAGLTVVAAGPGIAAALADRHVGVSRTVVNGVSPVPPPSDRSALEHELGLRPETSLVLAVGRLVEQKNFGLALRALERIPGAALVVVGDGPLRGQLEHERDRLGLDGRVVFAGIRTDARSLIGAVDAVVMPSRWEGMPLVALETLAAGKPLVATHVRGLRELLSDGEDALLVPAEDEAALARALERVLDDSDLAEQLRAGGLRTASRYDEQAMVDAYLDLYEELVA